MSYSYDTGWDVEYTVWADALQHALEDLGLAREEAEKYADREWRKLREAYNSGGAQP